LKEKEMNYSRGNRQKQIWMKWKLKEKRHLKWKKIHNRKKKVPKRNGQLTRTTRTRGTWGEKRPSRKRKCTEKKMFEPQMQKADRYRIGTDKTPRILVNHHQRLPCLASSLSGANSMAVSYTSIAFWIWPMPCRIFPI
jgi:hypothetical protein